MVKIVEDKEDFVTLKFKVSDEMLHKFSRRDLASSIADVVGRSNNDHYSVKILAGVAYIKVKNDKKLPDTKIFIENSGLFDSWVH